MINKKEIIIPVFGEEDIHPNYDNHENFYCGISYLTPYGIDKEAFRDMLTELIEYAKEKGLTIRQAQHLFIALLKVKISGGQKMFQLEHSLETDKNPSIYRIHINNIDELMDLR